MKKIKLPNWLTIAINIIKFVIQNRQIFMLIKDEIIDVFKKIGNKWKEARMEKCEGGSKITKDEAIDLFFIFCEEILDVGNELKKLKNK